MVDQHVWNIECKYIQFNPSNERFGSVVLVF